MVATGQLLRGLTHYSAGRIGEGERRGLAALDGYRLSATDGGAPPRSHCLADVHFLRGEIEPGLEIMHEALDLLDELGALRTPRTCGPGWRSG